MSYITLVRHGQANSAARDEISYDRLSNLGVQQAAWLGQYLKDTRHPHVQLYSGTLRRHAQTVEAMQVSLPCVRDPRLDEMEYFTLTRAFEVEHGVTMPADSHDFVHYFPQVLECWQQGKLEGAPERFADFENRVRDALSEIGAGGKGPALVVTSGGLIAMSMRLNLGLDLKAMARMSLSILNSSMHRLQPVGDIWSPTLFNAVPHLETPERHAAKTYV